MYLAYAILVLLSIAIWVAIRWDRRRERGIDPIRSRVRQAAKLKWEQTAQVIEDGQSAPWTHRSVRFARGKEEAVLWHKDATITLVRDYAPPTFDDFVELEEWIKRNPRNAELDAAAGERSYLRDIERFVIRHGYFTPLLEATTTDKSFFTAVTTFHKAGYMAQEATEVVAAVTLDALVRYGKDRSAALRFLAASEQDFRTGR